MTVELVPDPDHYAEPGPAYRVLLDGEDVGVVFRGMTTFERGPQQARYVTSRWSAPRWYGNRHNLDRTTRWSAVADVLQDHAAKSTGERGPFHEYEDAARAAKVRR